MEKSKRNKENKKRLAVALKRNIIRRKQKEHNTKYNKNLVK
ncbi:MAG: hypothetical protein sGL2_11530 [Candidatus Mesenet longicola]|nr:MAG: hypothetical protein sGL2_11530 [Candidatus Mesenet longicola]